MSSEHEVEALKTLSEIDLKVLQLSKQLAELPQKNHILTVRHKHKELEAKAAQVDSLRAQVERTLKLLTDETELTTGQLATTQKALDSSTDYRETTTLAAEMNLLASRIAKLEEDELTALEKQEKVATVAAQVLDAEHKLEAEEAAATRAYQEAGGKLKQEIADLQKAREALAAKLAPANAARYQKAVAAKSGIGAVHLAGNQCSGCHSTLSEGQLAKLFEGPLIGECPNCNRLMVAH